MVICLGVGDVSMQQLPDRTSVNLIMRELSEYGKVHTLTLWYVPMLPQKTRMIFTATGRFLYLVLKTVECPP